MLSETDRPTQSCTPTVVDGDRDRSRKPRAQGYLNQTEGCGVGVGGLPQRESIVCLVAIPELTPL